MKIKHTNESMESFTIFGTRVYKQLSNYLTN